MLGPFIHTPQKPYLRDLPWRITWRLKGHLKWWKRNHHPWGLGKAEAVPDCLRPVGGPGHPNLWHLGKHLLKIQVQFKCASAVPSDSEGCTGPQREPAVEPSFRVPISDPHFYALWPQESYSVPLTSPLCTDTVAVR